MEKVYFMLLLSVAVSTGLPTSTELEFKDDEKCCVSKVSQVLATSLLKSNIDIDGNQVHSPLGISTILAILAEGAAGQTYEEFQHVLGYPKNKEALRSSFKSLLEKYQNREENTQNPSFQTWLYIYRNYSAREEFKEIVSKNYYVDVKDISRSDYDWNEPNTSLDLSISSTSNSKDVIGFETLKRINVDDDEDTRKLTDNYGVEIVDKESSKFDRVVDDKQYVEKPVIIEEMKEDNITPVSVLLASEDQNSSIKDKREEEINLEENETVHDDEKIRKYNENVEKLIIPIKEVLESNEPEKLSLPLEKLENESDGSNSKEQSEMMMALESHITSVRQFYGRSLFQKNDITSALSANSITGRDLESKTKMLLFNGLYFRGNWAIPFSEIKDDQFFFMTSEDAVKTPMLHARGKFYTAELENLNAKVLCIPYESKKYTLMLLVPNDIEGLRSVIDKLDSSVFQYAKSKVQQKELEIILPKFQIEETSRSEEVLKNLGLNKVFSRNEADLSLMSEDMDLHVDEIVQFVNIRVDEGGSSEAAFSASNPQSRNMNENKMETFEINRPFLYFVMDYEKEFVIVSGKVYTPDFKEQNVSIEIELDRS